MTNIFVFHSKVAPTSWDIVKQTKKP